MNWLRNDSTKQVDQINDSNKLVDVISDSGKLVDAGGDPKSDPSSNPKVATHTTNGKFTQKLLISRFVPKIMPVIIILIKPLITTDVVGVQEILSPRQTVLPKGERHECGTQLCAHFPDSWEGKPHGQGQLHSIGRQI